MYIYVYKASADTLVLITTSYISLMAAVALQMYIYTQRWIDENHQKQYISEVGIT